MICPYCNIDMEPIELTGKLFCAHCGMTISSRKPEIRHLSEEKAPSPEKKQDEKPLPVGDGPRLSDIEKGTAKVDMGDYGDATKEAVETVFEDAGVAGAINQELGIDSPPDTPVTVTDQPNDFEAIAEKTDAQAETIDTTTIESLTDTDIPVHIHDVSNNEPTANWPVQEEEIPHKSFDESVKEIDMLGASGILLDILDEDAVDKVKSKQIESDIDKLEASEDVIEDILKNLPPIPKEMPPEKPTDSIDSIKPEVPPETNSENLEELADIDAIKSVTAATEAEIKAGGEEQIINEGTSTLADEPKIDELSGDENEAEKPFDLESALKDSDGIRAPETKLAAPMPTTEEDIPPAEIDYFHEPLPPDAPIIPVNENKIEGDLHYNVQQVSHDEPLAEDEPLPGQELVIPAPSDFHPDEKKDLPPEIMEILNEAKKEDEERAKTPMAVDKNTVTRERIKSVFNRGNDD